MTAAVKRSGGLGGRRASGFRNARVRESYALPLGWRHLTSVDIAQLKATVAELTGPDADLWTLEACLLVWATLVTGRHPAELLNLSVRMVSKGEHLAAGAPGMIGTSGRWGWWLPAAAPPGQVNATDAMRPTSPGVYLPATKIVARLVERCVAHRRRQSAGHVQLSAVPIVLFSHGEALLGEVSKIAANRHPMSVRRARRATTTPEAVARWLPAELVGAAGGDVVPASITTGRVPGPGQTAIYYGAVRHDELARRYREAIAPIDELSDYHVPAEVVATHVGDKLTPTDATVRDLIVGLTSALGDDEHDPAERHQAMVAYTVGLLCFAFAHRGGAGTMPSTRGVHAETRLCWIQDKAISGSPTRRLVWVCDTAFEQLRLYNAHLDQLQQEVSRPAAEAIASLRLGTQLPLFDMTSGRVERVTVAAAARVAMSRPRLPKNAGRHWLRARLVGQCSTETLHALFGHGPAGDGPWDATSTLDPAVYRADLARVLDPTLNAIGWIPRAPGSDPHR